MLSCNNHLLDLVLLQYFLLSICPDHHLGGDNDYGGDQNYDDNVLKIYENIESLVFQLSPDDKRLVNINEMFPVLVILTKLDEGYSD